MVATGLGDQEQEREREKRGMGWEVPLMWRGEMGKGKGGGVMSKDGGDGAARNQRIVGEKEWAAVVAGADNALRGEVPVRTARPSGYSAGANRGWEFQKHGQGTCPGLGFGAKLSLVRPDLDGDDDQECLPAGVDPHPGLCNVEITATGPITSGEELGEVSSSQRLPATKPKSPGVPGVSGREKNRGKGSRTGLPGLTGLEKSLFAALTNVKFPRATTDHRPGTEMASLGPV
ncbi:hypothetical protein CCUS01_09780 [Colletotrichum cuscutae]|uniref:Uncharacterized protein n=1 Tax=Colletotrichum cuscutae TaxID=1209917 RepID=A0AAI9XN96_9PEZI|nr:hypothetical protein CCUS01_09780 [Colletotrichum cuscutae]